MEKRFLGFLAGVVGEGLLGGVNFLRVEDVYWGLYYFGEVPGSIMFFVKVNKNLREEKGEIRIFKGFYPRGQVVFRLLGFIIVLSSKKVL